MRPTSSKAIDALKAAGIDEMDSVSYRSIRIINRVFREADDSHLWPILGAFSVADRAIRWYRRVYFRANGGCSNYEYSLGLEARESEIVNDPRNVVTHAD